MFMCAVLSWIQENFIQSIKVYASNTNLTFLYKIDIYGLLRFQQKKKKLVPVGIELTTDLHWFSSSMLIIQLC